MKPRTIVGIASAILALLLFFLSRYYASPRGLFARLVSSPVPNTVSSIMSEGHDWFGLAPEPVVRMRFSASREDLQKILTARKAKPLMGDAIGSGATSQPWWPAPPALGNMHGYSLKSRNPEFLWIDLTGTNAYYLLFGV